MLYTTGGDSRVEQNALVSRLWREGVPSRSNREAPRSRHTHHTRQVGLSLAVDRLMPEREVMLGDLNSRDRDRSPGGSGVLQRDICDTAQPHSGCWHIQRVWVRILEPMSPNV